MTDVVDRLGQAALMALGMLWQTGWSLVLGFTLSALLQSVVPADAMRRALGRDGVREVALATLAGAASSSCSYASAAIMRTMFKKGAALVTSLAFLFASTNITLELGLILYLLLGWQFMAAEWIGGVLLVAIMSVLVKLTYPRRLVEAARQHEEKGAGHHHMSMTVEGDTWWQRITKPETRVRVAQNFAMEWSMLWKDLAIGFVVGGLLSAFVPDTVWKALFLTDASPWLRIPLNAVVGPVVAALTFVCSIGNVPLAAVLWGGGASFGGILAFLYADLIVLPLLDVYRRYFGLKMAAYIGVVFFVTMVIAAIVIELVFQGLGWVPGHGADIRAHITHFSLNYTFWLNLLFGALAAFLFVVNARHPMGHDHAGHDHHDGDGAPAGHAAHPTR